VIVKAWLAQATNNHEIIEKKTLFLAVKLASKP
jgi:hypothetical protein